MVISELTESDLQPPTRSAGNSDRFPILNVGECDSFKSTVKYRAGGHFKEQALSLASQKIMVDDKGDGFQVKFPDIFADYQNPPAHWRRQYGKQGVAQLATHSDGLVAVPTELRGMVRDSWLRGLC